MISDITGWISSEAPSTEAALLTVIPLYSFFLIDAFNKTCVCFRPSACKECSVRFALLLQIILFACDVVRPQVVLCCGIKSRQATQSPAPRPAVNRQHPALSAGRQPEMLSHKHPDSSTVDLISILLNHRPRLQGWQCLCRRENPFASKSHSCKV